MEPSFAELWPRLPGVQHLDSPAAALTFDDGPDREGTPAVLDALDAIGAHATFFVVGEQLVRHHDIAREAVARGHELALHGFEHVDHSALTAAAGREDLDRGLWAFEAVLGLHPRRFRPPYGRLSPTSHEACRELDLEVVYWSVVPGDWLPASADEIAARVIAGLDDGAIVLMHDSARYGDRPSALPTARALARIGESAREQGRRLGSLAELTAPADASGRPPRPLLG